MQNMKKLIDAFERVMVAVTFAEAGNQETALKFMKEKPTNRRKQTVMNLRKHVDRRPVLRA